MHFEIFLTCFFSSVQSESLPEKANWMFIYHLNLTLYFLFIGHGFTLAKVEFMARYQRQRGKNVLFPFAFHCTGMPIGAAALRLARELKTGATSSGQPTPEEYEKLKKQNKDYEKP